MQGLPSGSLAMTVLLRSTPPFLSSVQQYTHTSRICDNFYLFLYIYIYKIYSFIFHVSFLVYLSFIFFVQKDLETSQRAFYIFNISELISSSFFYYLYNFSRYLDSNESESKEYNFYLLKKRFV